MARTQGATTTATAEATASGANPLVFGLGGNVGDREAVLRWAVHRLRRLYGPLAVAPLYRTAPVSPIPQAYFFNTVTLTYLPPDDVPNPREILMQIKALERRTGRLDGPRDRPRTLDVDLLLLGDMMCSTGPILPHPRMHERRFVLAPLNDIAPDLAIPPDGARVKDLLAALGSGQEVEKINWNGARFPEDVASNV